MARLIIILVVLSNFLSCYGLVSGWGEVCEDTQECNDHRYICAYDEESGQKICVCDRFHEWRGNATGCFPKYNTTTVLRKVVVISNRENAMEVARGSAFTVQVVAGLFVFITVGVASCSVCVYCWHIRKKDRALRLEIEELMRRKRRRVAGTSAEV